MLHRWTRAERPDFFTRKVDYEDVTDCYPREQFIRPLSSAIAEYLRKRNFECFLGDFVWEQGAYEIYIGSVARNYISIRSELGRGVLKFSFSKIEDFYRFLGLVTSDIFMEYWRSVGDGFHLTKANILNFPVSAPLAELVESSIQEIRNMWLRRKEFEKTKLNSGTLVRSYDFSPIMSEFNFEKLHKLLIALD